MSAYSGGGDNSRTLQMTSNVANRLGFRSTGGVNNSSASGGVGGASMHQPPVAMRNTTVRRAGGDGFWSMIVMLILNDGDVLMAMLHYDDDGTDVHRR